MAEPIGGTSVTLVDVGDHVPIIRPHPRRAGAFGVSQGMTSDDDAGSGVEKS